jgi:DNA topoisomerase-3
MEVQMKAICEGRTTRHDVVQQNLEQYRAVFNRTAQQINVLKSVCQYYSGWACVVGRLREVLQAIKKYVLGEANQG